MNKSPLDNQAPPSKPQGKEPAPSSGLSDMARMYIDVRASLVRYTSRYFRRSQEAEDVVQEAFLKVIEAQRKRSIDSPVGYLFRTVRNISLRQISKSSYKLTDELSDVLTESDLLVTKTLEEQYEVRENFEMFCRAVRSLPVRCQRAFVLSRVYGFSQKEIAEHMDIGVKAVEGHLSRATRRCVDFMEAEQSSHSGGQGVSQKEPYHG